MENSKIFINNCLAIKEALNISDEDFFDLLYTDPKKGKKYIKNPDLIPAFAAMNFCSEYDIDVVAIFQDDFEVDCFVKNHTTIDIAIPSKYSKDQNSRAMTLLNLCKAFDQYNLTSLTDFAFRRLQVPKKILKTPNSRISIGLLVDFFDIISKEVKNDQITYSAGYQSFLKDGAMFDFSNASIRNIQDAYEFFLHQEIRKIDHSYNYSILKMTDHYMEFESSTKDEICESYKTKSLATRASNVYKAGIASAVTTLVGTGPSHATYTRRDNRDIFTIQFPLHYNSVEILQ